MGRLRYASIAGQDIKYAGQDIKYAGQMKSSAGPDMPM
jgi:hypothetical protein